MTLFPDLSFFLFLPIYFVSVVLAFFIPGDLFLKKVTLTTVQRIVVALTIGITLWALQGLLFGYLQVRFLSYAYLCVTTAVWMMQHKTIFKIGKLQLKFWLPSVDRISLLIVILGGTLQLASVWLLGFRQESGVLFCCRSVPDSIYHLALTQELVMHFPPTEPGSAGIIVKNYHYLANLVLADLVRVFSLPLIPTVYQYSSLFLIIFSGLTAAAITQFLKVGKVFQRWFLFFLFFAGDMIYGLVFLRTGKIDFSYTIIDDASKILTGPPRSFSLALFFGLVAIILLWHRERKIILGILIALVAGILLEFKVYTGIVTLAGLGTLTLWRVLKKDYLFVGIFALAVVISFLTYLPVNNGAGGLIFSGTWRFENFMSQPQFNFQTLELSRLTYLAENNYLRVFSIELFYGAVYLITMLGVTLLALFQTPSSLKKLPFEVTLFVGTALIASLFLGLFFIQSVGGANTIQFIIHYLTLSSLFLAITLEKHLSKLPKIVALFIAAIFIIFTASRSISEGLGNITDFANREKFTISNENLATAEYIKKFTPQEALIMLSPREALQGNSMYLTFFANRPLYLAGLSDHGVSNLNSRQSINQEIFTNTDCNRVKSLLTLTHTSIVFVTANAYPKCSNKELGLEELYQHEDNVLLKNTNVW